MRRHSNPDGNATATTDHPEPPTTDRRTGSTSGAAHRPMPTQPNQPQRQTRHAEQPAEHGRAVGSATSDATAPRRARVRPPLPGPAPCFVPEVWRRTPARFQREACRRPSGLHRTGVRVIPPILLVCATLLWLAGCFWLFGLGMWRWVRVLFGLAWWLCGFRRARFGGVAGWPSRGVFFDLARSSRVPSLEALASTCRLFRVLDGPVRGVCAPDEFSVALPSGEWLLLSGRPVADSAAETLVWGGVVGRWDGVLVEADPTTARRAPAPPMPIGDRARDAARSTRRTTARCARRSRTE